MAGTTTPTTAEQFFAMSFPDGRTETENQIAQKPLGVLVSWW
jgi:hypothetical protein